MLQRLRELLVFVRPHTAALTMSVCVLAFVMGSVNADTTYSLMVYFLVAVSAFLFHISGFGENNYYDWEFDKHDSHKRHFACNTGALTKRQAYIYVRLLQALTVLVFVSIVLYVNYFLGYGTGVTLPIAIYVVAVVFGNLYNRTCKSIRYLPPIFLSISLTAFCLAYYVISTLATDFYFYVFMAMVFITGLYQIAVSGYYKDIESDPVNLLRDLGAKVTDGLFVPSGYVILFGYALFGMRLVVHSLPLIVCTEVNNTNFICAVVVCIFLILGALFVNEQLSEHDYTHMRATRLCALIEICFYMSIPPLFVIMEVLTPLQCVFLMVFPLVWYIAWNRVLWGRGWSVAPKV